MMSMFFFTVPAFMLSGFAFPIANMPEAVQWLTFLNPARYFMEIVRGLFLKGAGIAALWPQMTALFVYGVGRFRTQCGAVSQEAGLSARLRG